MKLSKSRYLAAVSAATVLAVIIPAGAASATEADPSAQPTTATAPSVAPSSDPAEESQGDPEPDPNEEAPEQVSVPDLDDSTAEGTTAPDFADQPGRPVRGNPDCKGAWNVTKWKRFPARLGKVGPNFSSYFGNGGSQTLSAGVTGTLGVILSSKVEVGASAATFVTAKAEVSGSLSTSVAVTASLAETQPVPKGRWGNAYWGATTVPVTFHLVYRAANTCKITKSKDVTAYYPWSPAKTVGWCKWVSKKSLGSRPKQCTVGPYIPA